MLLNRHYVDRLKILAAISLWLTLCSGVLLFLGFVWPTIFPFFTQATTVGHHLLQFHKVTTYVWLLSSVLALLADSLIKQLFYQIVLWSLIVISGILIWPSAGQYRTLVDLWPFSIYFFDWWLFLHLILVGIWFIVFWRSVLVKFKKNDILWFVAVGFILLLLTKLLPMTMTLPITAHPPAGHLPEPIMLKQRSSMLANIEKTHNNCQNCHQATQTPIHQSHLRTGEINCLDCHRGANQTHAILEPRAGMIATSEFLHTRGFEQATCLSCHQPNGPPQGAELQEFGQSLWQEAGCAGCHESNENALAPSLKKVANWWALYPLTSTGENLLHEGWPPLAAFLAEAIEMPTSHLTAPLTPSAQPAIMPKYVFSKDEMKALTIYLLSLRDFGFASDLSGPTKKIAPIDLGRAVFTDLEKGCTLCHQLAGEGGQLGPSLDNLPIKNIQQLWEKLSNPLRKPLAGYFTVDHHAQLEKLTQQESLALQDYLAKTLN